jgi:hypothetical protein
MSDWNDNKFVATISDSDSADGAIIRLIYFDGDDYLCRTKGNGSLLASNRMLTLD